jgi:GxxExxY protein
VTIDELTEQVIGLAMKIHRTMGTGFLESVYHRCMEIELGQANLDFDSNSPLNVYYQGRIVGQFEADIVIKAPNVNLIIELKACENLCAAHEVQTVNYLTATGLDNALLINFGSAKLQFKRKHRQYKPRLVQNHPI